MFKTCLSILIVLVTNPDKKTHSDIFNDLIIDF